MRIFINSCGYSRQDPSHEYRWKCLTQDPAIDAVEELNRKRFAGLTLSDLIESDSRMPSMVLARDGTDLILLITRIPSLTRLGSQGDTIYSSLLMVGKNHNLLLLRRLAANLLASIPPQPNDFAGIGAADMPPNLIQSVLDTNIKFQDSSAFVFNEEVDFESEIEAACDDQYSALPVQQNGFLWRPCIGHNCFKLRQELAYEIARFSLPLTDGPIAVATGYKNPFFAQKAEAWRTLSLLIEGISWQPVQASKRALRRRDKAEATAGGYAVASKGMPGLAALGAAIGIGNKEEKFQEKER